MNFELSRVGCFSKEIIFLISTTAQMAHFLISVLLHNTEIPIIEFRIPKFALRISE